MAVEAVNKVKEAQMTWVADAETAAVVVKKVNGKGWAVTRACAPASMGMRRYSLQGKM